jgi:ATP-dependent RNA helicase DeaD
MSFKELGLHDSIVQTISNLGFAEPTAIQKEAIPVLLRGNTDFIGLAQTGTGKTAAFGLPIIQQIELSQLSPQAIIVCPTRELCVQITSELENYSKHLKGLRIVSVYGGASMTNQLSALKRGVHIVVGTPGRLIDHLERRTLDLSNIRTVVLDEADEMLKMGFQDDVDAILAKVPAKKNLWLFSATMPGPIAKITKQYMTNPATVTIGQQNSSAVNLEHFYCMVSGKDAFQALKRFVDAYPGFFGIVFCRTKRDARQVADWLNKAGYNADALHGDLSQAQRDFVMNKFRNSNLDVLVATDVAARGIDVSNVTHVIHYHLPDDAENYTHRSGRTARAGKSGVSIALVTSRERSRIRYIERDLGVPIKLIEIPTGSQICAKQVEHFLKSVTEASVNDSDIANYLPKALDFLKDISKEEIIKRVVSFECNRFLKAYNGAETMRNDFGGEERGGREERSEPRSGSRVDGARREKENRLFINVGSVDGLNKKSLIQLIASKTSVAESSMNQISLNERFAFFNVETLSQAEQIVSVLQGTSVNGRKVRIELSSNKPASKPARRENRRY